MKLLLLAVAAFLPLLASAEDRGPKKIRIGDMVIVEGQLEFEEPRKPRSLSSASGGLVAMSYVRSGTAFWPDGRLPIEFSSGISSAEKKLVLDACREWQLRAKVRCVLSSTAKVRVKVIKGDGCYSEVGYGSENLIGQILPGDRKDVRELSLGTGCWSKSIIIHELGHAFGLTHEHQRPDRDKFLRVLWANVEEDQEHNFKKHTGGKTYGIPYDFKSIMHYSQYAFGRGSLKSWVPAKGKEAAARSAGSARLPSYYDGRTMSAMYGGPAIARGGGGSW